MKNIIRTCNVLGKIKSTIVTQVVQYHCQATVGFQKLTFYKFKGKGQALHCSRWIVCLFVDRWEWEEVR